VPTALSHEILVETANTLPPLPQSVVKLSELFADPDYAIADLVRAVELDPSLGGRLLRMANSSTYGSGQVGTIGEAIVRVGSGTVKSIAIASSVRPSKRIDLSAFGMTAESYWEHCIAVVSFAEVLAMLRPGQFSDEFSTAAMLHDFGKLVLAKNITSSHVDILQQMKFGESRAEKEMQILSVDHAEVTAVVARHWKLSERLVKAVQHHHHPERFDDPLTHGLNVANQMAWRLEEREYDLESECDRREHSIAALGLSAEEVESAYHLGMARMEQTLSSYL